MKETQIDFARHGAPLELMLMDDYGWLPWEIDRLPYRTLLELKALRQLKDELGGRKKG